MTTPTATMAVLGPGGVGGFLAAALDHAGHSPTLVAREPTAATIAEHGITLQSTVLGDFTARPAVVSTLTEPVDVLFVATKAVGLKDALDRIQAPVDLVVPLLNGLDHMAILRERFGSGHVCAATIRIDADRPQTGTIIQTGKILLIELGHDGPEPAEAKLGAVMELLNGAEIPARLGGSESQVLWHKLVILNAIAATTAAMDAPIGVIRDDPAWRQRLLNCVREGAAVAAADGAEIDVEQQIAFLDRLHESQGSSLQRDVSAGRESELDWILGAVLRAGERHGLACPTISELYEMIAAKTTS